MSYDSNGMRTQKTVDGVKTNYYYDSNKNLIALVKGNDTLLFYYDSDGSATSFSYNGMKADCRLHRMKYYCR